MPKRKKLFLDKKGGLQLDTIALVILIIVIVLSMALYAFLVREQERKKKKSPLSPWVQEELAVELTPFNQGEEKPCTEKKEESALLPSRPSLPFSYGKEVLVAMVRDPRCIFCYWDYGPTFQIAGEARIQLLEITGQKENSERIEKKQEYPISLPSKNYYLTHCLPDKLYFIQLGYRKEDGSFIPCISSNRVHTPRDYPAEVTEGDWITTWRFYEQNLLLMQLGDVAGTVSFVEKLQEKREQEMASPGFPWGRKD